MSGQAVARVEKHTGALKDMAIIVWLGEQPDEGTLLYTDAPPAIEPYYAIVLRQVFDALTPFLDTLPDGTALLNTTPTQQELWRLHAAYRQLGDAARKAERAALAACKPARGAEGDSYA